MTVVDLWSYALKGSKAVHPVALNKLNGKTVGIDISIWMHRLCATDAVALCMTCRPRYLPSNALSLLQLWHNTLVNEGIKPYYVFDGCRHPMKSVARLKRDAEKRNLKTG